MKKLLSAVMVLCMMFSIASCSSNKDDSNIEEQQQATYQVEGTAEEVGDGSLKIKTRANEDLIFDISNAAVVTEKDIEKGDDISVLYSGEVKENDTSNVKVVKVVDTGAEVITLKATVVNIKNDKLTVRSGGKKLTFDINNAEVHYKNGIKKGNIIHISYSGKIKGTDTSLVTVHEIIDNEMNKERAKHDKNNGKNAVKISKVNETVYATCVVRVRKANSLSSEVVGSLNYGESVKRIGIYDNGWSRIEYNGRVACVSTHYLSTDKPKEKVVSSTTKEETKKKTAKKDTKKDNKNNKKKDNTTTGKPASSDTKIIEGTIEDATMNNLIVKVTKGENKGKKVDILTDGVEIHTKNGLIIGNKVKVVYQGSLKNIILIVDNDANIESNSDTADTSEN